MKRSPITWTDYSGGDANFVLRGSQHGDCEISPGCQNCYAYLLRQKNRKQAPEETTFNESKLRKLMRSKPKENDAPYRRGQGSRPMVFVCDMGDLFHRNVPDDFIIGAIEAMSRRNDIDFQILTKRAERMATLLSEVPENVWVGVTAENQEMADRRIPHLLKVKASVRFLSVEPMLERISIPIAGVSWVICGAESGPKRRPFDKSWASELWDQCQAADVPFFFKQGSHIYPGRDDLLNGEHVKEWPRS
jgi:protein gp37